MQQAAMYLSTRKRPYDYLRGNISVCTQRPQWSPATGHSIANSSIQNRRPSQG